MSLDFSGIPSRVIIGLVKELINDWESKDFEIYFRMAYQDPQVQFYFETNSYNIGKAVAPVIARAIANRMITLRNNDHNSIERE